MSKQPFATPGAPSTPVAFGASGFAPAPAPDAPALCRSELIFPLDHRHNHASCTVECPNGDLLVCWYRGSGERQADDVCVLGARRRYGEERWSAPFVMANTPGFPDTNPCLLIDTQSRLWLLWAMIQANEWHTALMKYQISYDYQMAEGPPRWQIEKVLHLRPDETFEPAVQAALESLAAQANALPEERRERALNLVERIREGAADKYFRRLGWMTRAHPFVLDRQRIIVPLYSDGFSFSLMAITDDGGETWTASPPLVALGNVQPSIVRKRDGTLVTYMRDNGPPPKRLHVSESADGGLTWSPVRDSELPNPGSGAEVIGLRSGRWALIYNDTERGRHSLAVSLSEDDGATWKWTRHLEREPAGDEAGSFHYPSITQARDGTLHASYSFFLNRREVTQDAEGRPLRKSIKHSHFNEAWVMAG